MAVDLTHVHARVKQTAEDHRLACRQRALAIREAIDAGMTHEQVAELLGISRARVTVIVNTT